MWNAYREISKILDVIQNAILLSPISTMQPFAENSDTYTHFSINTH